MEILVLLFLLLIGLTVLGGLLKLLFLPLQIVLNLLLIPIHIVGALIYAVFRVLGALMSSCAGLGCLGLLFLVVIGGILLIFDSPSSLCYTFLC